MRLFNNNEKSIDSENIELENEVLEESTDDKAEPIESSKIIEEDALLIQIDEFRRKAEALQTLINERQNKVLDLEATVREKESKNSELQEELAKKQEVLNSVLEDMKSQFDILASRVDTSVNNAVSEAKEPIFEKIHTENVRLYRNVYDFIKEDYNREELDSFIKECTKTDTKPFRLITFISLINLVAIVAVLLVVMGIL